MPVFYYACEISAELTAARAFSIVSDMGFDDMYNKTAKFKAKVRRELEAKFITGADSDGSLLLNAYPAKTAGIADIRQHAKTVISSLGITPKVIVIDHAETIKPASRVERSSDWRQQADVYTEARALGQELGAVVVMPDRCNKETVQQPVPHMASFQGAFEKAGIVDVAIGLCQTPEERLKNYIRYFVFINRHGRQFDYFHGSVKENRFQMTIEDSLDFEKAQAEFEEKRQSRSRSFGKGKGERLPHALSDEDPEKV